MPRLRCAALLGLAVGSLCVLRDCKAQQPPPMPPADSFCFKESYGRGVGLTPSHCHPGDQIGSFGLCYPSCTSARSCCRNSEGGTTRAGDYRAEMATADSCYDTTGDICWQSCADGYVDVGALCTYWDPLPHTYAKFSCTRSDEGYAALCESGYENDAGLCYPICRPEYDGVGPMCWGPCEQRNPVEQGALCCRDSATCATIYGNFAQISLCSTVNGLSTLAGGLSVLAGDLSALASGPAAAAQTVNCFHSIPGLVVNQCAAEPNYYGWEPQAEPNYYGWEPQAEPNYYGWEPQAEPSNGRYRRRRSYSEPQAEPNYYGWEPQAEPNYYGWEPQAEPSNGRYRRRRSYSEPQAEPNYYGWEPQAEPAPWTAPVDCAGHWGEWGGCRVPPASYLPGISEGISEGIWVDYGDCTGTKHRPFVVTTRAVDGGADCREMVGIGPRSGDSTCNSCVAIEEPVIVIESETPAPSPSPSAATSSSCTGPEFMARSQAVTAACCDADNLEATCPGGMPTACSTACAELLLPMQRDCASMVTMMGLENVIASAAAECPAPEPSIPCGTGQEFFAYSQMVTAACCGDSSAACDTGFPTAACSTECAALVLPMQSACGRFVTMMEMADVVANAEAECQSEPAAVPPPPCATGPEFMAYSQMVATACCGDSSAACDSGFPTAACSTECAALVLPMQSACGDLFTMMVDATAFNTAAAVCRSGGATGSGH